MLTNLWSAAGAGLPGKVGHEKSSTISTGSHHFRCLYAMDAFQ